MLKALFIGGTGIISSGITRALAENADWELTILNRGKRAMEVPENVRVWTGDIDNREAVEKLLEGQFFDVVGGFYRFYTRAGKAGFRLFPGKMRPVFLYRNRVGVSKAADEPSDYGKHSAEKSLLAVFQRQNRLRRAADGRKTGAAAFR